MIRKNYADFTRLIFIMFRAGDFIPRSGDPRFQDLLRRVGFLQRI